MTDEFFHGRDKAKLEEYIEALNSILKEGE
jgi:hypothetical protein